MESNSWISLNVDACIYFGQDGLMLIVYVNDIIIVAKQSQQISEFTEILGKNFDIRIVGNVSFFLGFNILYNQDKRKNYISQSTYIAKVIQKWYKTE